MTEDHVHVHFAMDADRPGWTTAFADMQGRVVGPPITVDELERRARAIRDDAL